MSVTGLKTTIRDRMIKDSKTLYSVIDLIEEFKNHEQLKTKDLDHKKKAVDNILRNLRVAEEIHRHVDRDERGDLQYAASIAESKIEVWIKSETMGQGNTNRKNGVTKRRGKMLSSKEIRSMFAAHFNQLARLEDEAMKIIAEFEIMEKEMAKISSFLKR